MSLTLINTTFTFANGNTGLYNMPGSAIACLQRGYYVRFPAPWPAQSSDPGILTTITNHATTAPIAPILMDTWVSAVDGATYYHTFVELSTVHPGQTITNEPAVGLAVTQMYLVFFYLAIGITSTDLTTGWTVDVTATAV